MSLFAKHWRISILYLFDFRRIARHYLQLQASIEVLRMLELPEIFHSFAPTDYVELLSAATVRSIESNENRDFRTIRLA